MINKVELPANHGDVRNALNLAIDEVNAILSIANNRVAMGNTVTDGTGIPNPSRLITVNMTGNGSDELLTPPVSPQPVTGGNYNSFQPIAFSEIESSGAISVIDGAIVIGEGGAGRYRTSHAWLDMASDRRANNVGFTFCTERNGELYFSSRVAGGRLSDQDDRTNISGGGFVDFEVGDKLSIWGCSELEAVITIYDANIGMEMVAPTGAA